jgi:putative hemolysin
MNPADLQGALAIFACLVVSALLSGAETAITSLGYLKAKHMLATNKPGAKSLQIWLQHPNRVLTTLLLSNNVVNILASAIGTTMATEYFDSQAIGISTGIMTFLIVTFTEVIPKSYAKTHSESIVVYVMKPVIVLYYVLWPFVWLFSEFAGKVVSRMGAQPSQQPVITEDELEFLVEVSERSGMLEKLKKKMLSGVFDFDEIKVREVMTPRTDMQAMPSNASYQDLLNLVIEWGYSRIPIYHETIDNIVGMVLAKDLLTYSLKLQNPENFSIKQIMRKVIFVPESNFINDVFRDLKTTKTHIAIVIDEHGGTAGLVTLEDIIETIVGEIQDEHDEEEQEFRKLGDNIYQVSGAATIDDFLEFFTLEEEKLAEKPEGDIDTLGGWLTQLLQDMPKVGQTVQIENLKIEITRIDRHRVRSVRVIRLESEGANDDVGPFVIQESVATKSL